MPIDATFELDQSTVNEFFRAINQASKQLGKSNMASLQWGARTLCTSLAGETRQVRAKLRPIIKNPNKRAATDRRMAPYGAKGMKDGKDTFIPIYRTGQFGSVRFFDKKTFAWFDRSGGSGKWKKVASGADPANPDIIVPGIMTDRRRKIPRRGMAKKVWRAAQALIGRGGEKKVEGVSSIASVRLNRSEIDPTVHITNRLRYATAALKGGASSIDSAMRAATRSLIFKIGQQVDKRLGIKS